MPTLRSLGTLSNVSSNLVRLGLLMGSFSDSESDSEDDSWSSASSRASLCASNGLVVFVFSPMSSFFGLLWVFDARSLRFFRRL